MPLLQICLSLFWLASFTFTYIRAIASKRVYNYILQDLLPNQEVHLVSDNNIDELDAQDIQSLFTSASSKSSKTDLDLEHSIANIYKSSKNVAIIIDLPENKVFEALHYVGNNSEKMRTITRVWTVVIWPTSMKTKEEIEGFRDNVNFTEAVKNFRISSQLFFAFNLAQSSDGTINEATSEIIFYEAYLAGNHTIFQVLQNGSTYLHCQFCEGMALRRFNFHHRLLKVTAVNDSEVNDDILVYEDSNGTIKYSEKGFSGEMHEILQQLLNFTTEPMLSKGFGSFNNQTNRWEGSIGDVSEGKADIGMSITIFQPDRASVVSFLPPADEHLINAFFMPSDDHPIRDIFAHPFKPLLWAAVFTTWIVLASCMVIFSLVRKRYGLDEDAESDENADEDRPEPDFTNDSFIWAVGTACQQGWDDHPKSNSLRAIFISGSVTGVVAYAGYSAAIVSTLSVQTDPIQNPVQLLKSSLHVGIRKGFINNLLQQENASDTISQFLKKVEQSHTSERHLNVSSGLDRLLKHPYAFITTKDTIYDLLKNTTDEKVICAIKDLPMLKSGFPIGYPVPKFSQFREILRYALVMIREPGVLYRLRQLYSYKRRCLDASNNAGYALGANDVFTAFMILSGGFVLSISILIVERMYSLHKQIMFVE